jgi:hypothetical protein
MFMDTNVFHFLDLYEGVMLKMDWAVILVISGL